jgi:glycosyltransferase involved in cell wall biosynthesis
LNTPCVLLPIYNAQASLEKSVSEILETLGELTGHFKLCILDDGSTDETADTAYELAARYPQIKLIRHPVRLGLGETIQTALDNTDGELILIGDEDYRLDPDDLRTLWQLRENEQRLAERSWEWRDTLEQQLSRLLAWRPGTGGSRAQRGFQIIHRQAFEQFRLAQAAQMHARLDGQRSAATAARPKYLGKASRFVWQD